MHSPVAYPGVAAVLLKQVVKLNNTAQAHIVLTGWHRIHKASKKNNFHFAVKSLCSFNKGKTGRLIITFGVNSLTHLIELYIYAVCMPTSQKINSGL